MLKEVKGKLIISCQALPEEPLHSSFIMGRMALAATQGGASGIRAQSMEDIIEIKKNTDLPIIGIVKRKYDDSEIYITATKKEVDELLAVGCDMIALDATNRSRPNGEKIEDLVTYIKSKGVETMADCSTFEECLEAERIGFDCVSTTLCGYTPYSKYIDGPNFELMQKLVEVLKVPLIAEGKINTPEDLRKALDIGVHCAVVGGAITRPLQIAKTFSAVIK